MGMFDTSRRRLEALEHEVLSNPTPQNMKKLAEDYARAGDLKHALDVAKRAVEKFPDSETCALTYQYIRKQQFTTEIQDLNRAIRTSPSQQTYERLGSVYLSELGDRNKALEVAMEGLHKFPSSESLHLICAQVRIDRFHTDYTANDVSEAIHHAEQALKMNSSSPVALWCLARLYAEVGAYAKAKPKIDQYLRANPGDEAMRQLLKLVEAHVSEGVDSVDDALAEIEQRHGLSPTGQEMLQIFQPVRGATQVNVSPAKVENFLRGYEQMSGYKCSMVMTRGGQFIAGHSRGMIQQDKFVNLVQNIFRCAEDASRRMDLGDFRDGEITSSIGVVKIAEWKNLVLGLLAAAPAKPEDFSRAVDKFHAFVV